MATPAAAATTATAAAAPRVEFVSQLMKRTGIDEERAKDAEVGVYNWVLEYAGRTRTLKSWRNHRFAAVYASKARSVICNMDPDAYVQNLRLLTRLREDEFAPHDVAWMRPETVHPDRWQQTIDLKTQQDHYLDTAKPAAMTDAFKCKRCSKRECVYTEMQLRSSDEPTSLFICCLNCGERWRRG